MTTITTGIETKIPFLKLRDWIDVHKIVINLMEYNTLSTKCKNVNISNTPETSKIEELKIAKKLINTDPSKINKYSLSKNIYAIKFLHQHPELISSYNLFVNPNGYELIAKNDLITTICNEPFKNDFDDALKWGFFSRYATNLELLRLNPDKICWYSLTQNPAIFTYDYNLIRKKYSDKNNCVTEWFYHPRFINKYLKMENNLIDGYEEYMLNKYVV